MSEREVICELIDWRDNGFPRGISMPPRSYYDRDLFSLEKDRIFRQGWVCVGRSSELQASGDYITRIVSDQPLILLKDGANKIRAMSNVCRHRHALLVEGCGNVSRIICPYHAWTYNLDGTLIAAPFMDIPNDSGCNLPSYSIQEWYGFVFVHLGSPVKDIASLASGLESDLIHYQLDRQFDVYSNEVEISTNWKMMVENFTESYHLFRVHPDTLEPYTPTKLLEVGEPGLGFSRHYVYYKEKFRQQPKGRKVPQPHCDREVVTCLYPNLLIVAAPDSTVWACIEPKDVDKILLRYGVLQHEAYKSESNYDQIIQEQIDLTEAFNAEDKVLLESIFRGVSAPDATASTLCPFEKTLLDFAHYYTSIILQKS